MLPKNWILTVILLFLGLAGVIYIQSQLSAPAQKEIPAQDAIVGNTINWCDQTVTGLSMPGQFHLQLVDGTWQMDGAEVSGVEAWMKTHCSLSLDHVQKDAVAKMLNQLLSIEYQNGKIIKSFQIDPTGRYAWQGQLFMSNRFDLMLSELRALVRK